MLGVLFALLSSASFGMNSASIRRGVLTASAGQGLYVTILFGLPLFLLAALVSGQIFHVGDLAPRSYVYLALAGLLHITFGRYCNYRAIAAIGANRSAPIVGLSTLVSLVVAILFLHEVVTPLKGAGIVLILLGPALVGSGMRRGRGAGERGSGGDKETRGGGDGGTRRGPAANGAPASTVAETGGGGVAVAATPKVEAATAPLRVVEGYVFGLLGAASWGVGPVLMRAGVADTGLGVLAGTVSYAAAAALLLPSLLLPGRLAQAVRMDASGSTWFLVSTGNSFVANLFRYMALSLAPVIIVIPIMRTSIIFGLLFNWVINRKNESFDPRVIAGILLSLVGAVLLVVPSP